MRHILAGLAMVAMMAAGSAALASPVQGADDHPIVIDGKDFNSHAVVLQGGQLSDISVLADADTFTTVEVYDEAGNLVATDSDPLGAVELTFLAPVTGKYNVVVFNNALVSDQFDIVTT